MAVRVYGLNRGQERGEIVVTTGAAIGQELQIHIDEDLISNEEEAKLVAERILEEITAKDWPS